jgi:hypothetical protein
MPANMIWTERLVAERMVQAYRLVPGYPVMSAAGACGAGEAGAAVALCWTDRFVRDPWARSVLLTWARCKSRGESVRERYRDFGWQRSTAERRRREALAAIVRGLNSELGLDNGTNSLGA